MSMTTNTVSVALRDVDNTAPSIQRAASSMMKLYDSNANGVVTIWRNVLQNCRSDQLLPLLYVCNEVIQTSKRNRGNKFLEAFGVHLQQSLVHICTRVTTNSSSTTTTGSDIVEKIRRVIKIWGDRQIFSFRFVNELLNSLEPFRSGSNSNTNQGSNTIIKKKIPPPVQKIPVATTTSSAATSSSSPEGKIGINNNNTDVHQNAATASTTSTASTSPSSSTNNEINTDNTKNDDNNNNDDDDIMEMFSELDKKRRKKNSNDSGDDDNDSEDDDDDDDDIFGDANNDSQRSVLNIDIDNVVGTTTTITDSGNGTPTTTTSGTAISRRRNSGTIHKRRRSSTNNASSGSGTVDPLLGVGAGGVPMKLSVNHFMELLYRLIQLKQQSDLAIISINQIKVKISTRSTPDGTKLDDAVTTTPTTSTFSTESLQNLVGDELVSAKRENDSYIQQLLQHRTVLYQSATEQKKIEELVCNYYMNWIEGLIQQDDVDMEFCSTFETTLKQFYPIHQQIVAAHEKRIKEQQVATLKKQQEEQARKEREENEQFRRVALAKNTEAKPGMVWNRTTREYQSINTDESWRD